MVKWHSGKKGQRKDHTIMKCVEGIICYREYCQAAIKILDRFQRLFVIEPRPQILMVVEATIFFLGLNERIF